MNRRRHVRNRGLVLILAAGTCLARSAATVADNPQQVDALVVEAQCDIDQGCSTQEDVVIPRTQVAALCGDSDGCTLRLAATGGVPGDLEFPHRGTYFKTSADGFAWWLALDLNDDLYRHGALDETPDEVIYFLWLGRNNVSQCGFMEKKIGIQFFASYVLRANQDFGQDSVLRCTLRIDD